MNRRNFLGITTAVATSAILPNLASAREYKYEPIDYKKELNDNSRIENEILPFSGKERDDFWSKPRRIFLKRERTGEQSELYYHSNGQLNQKQYWMASYLLRDVEQKKMVYVDPKLLDLMCAVQAWLVYSGNSNPLSIVSGFRTQRTNNGLEGAAKNSMHLYGKALDFRVSGLKITSLASIADQFNAGGIGLYPSSNFLHLDTGGVRKWYGGSWNKKG